MGNLRHVITYKKTETWVYDEVEKHSGKGNWVKDILIAYLKGNLVYVDNTATQQASQIPLKKAKSNIDLSELGDLAPK